MLAEQTTEYLNGYYAALSHIDDFFPRGSSHVASLEVNRKMREILGIIQNRKLKTALEDASKRNAELGLTENS